MEDNQDEYAEQSFSSSPYEMGDIFGDPQVLPHVGDEYQAEIPPLIAECDLLQLINTSRNSDFMLNIHQPFLLGLPLPLMWSHAGVESINGTVEFENSEESQITSNNESPEHKVEPLDTISGYGKNIGIHSNIQQAAGSDKMEVDSVLLPESAIKMDLLERGFCPLPGLLGESWTDVEHDSFLLGLYIFGKNLVAVKKFVSSKKMGDILSFYYGKFYRSDGYYRWSECRKLRSRQSIHGRKIFTGWRQQELLSRLFSHVSQKCQGVLLEVSRAFTEGKISFAEYVFTLKGAVGINMLIEAVGIGKGKHDLTGTAMEPIKPNHTISVRPEIPIGKACSSLTSADIIKFLTGNFRLSKARSSDLFWEAVWPRLLTKGWHSEQPKDNGFSGSKHSLVFLIPGVKKFSRRRLVKANASQHKEECGWDPSLKEDQDDVSSKQRRCYLQPRTPNYNRHVQKFTVVDTSLAHGAEQPKVRELRSLPVETTSVSTSSSLSSETEEDTSEDSQEESEEINTSNPADDVTEKRICVDSSYCTSSLLNSGTHSNPDPSTAAVEISLINDNEERKTLKYQFSRKVKSGCSKYLVPITKQQDTIACDPGQSNWSTKNMSTDKNLNIEDESHYISKSPDACEDRIFQVGPPQISPFPSSLAKDRPTESNEGIVGENFLGREASPEKPQSLKLIDLNFPHVSPDFAAEEHIMTDVEQNNDSSSFLSGTGQQPESFKICDNGVDPRQQPLVNNRRQSTRNRPLTTKALEALELGFFNTKKKRKGAGIPESNSISMPSRRVRGRVSFKATSKEGAVNEVADSRTGDISDGFHNNTDMVNFSQV
ncbi:uncharacterized protein LOC110640743 isoform X2 [Hevea brasiliensis]|uniref:uncharacterized protein LOC110640743 isoform X2 n=1 Tax=Hevea brasiliensis TaxID=3981 RepID=UPI0025EAD1BB|nr:uncharacterized protein LOC110640743 isoform X2 [Hevea brasiliensis]